MFIRLKFSINKIKPLTRISAKYFKIFEGLTNKFVYNREFSAENVWKPEKYKYKSPFVKHNDNILPDIEEDVSKLDTDIETQEILKEVFKARKSVDELISMSLYDQMKVIFN
jgi:hypothetical protein